MFRLATHRFGPPQQVLVYEPTDLPTVEPGFALVRMQASPINPSDLIPAAGAYRHRTSLPFVPGYEGVGVVMEVGGGVDPALIGRRVLPLGSAGNWQSWRALPADWCVLVPDDISDEQAALAYINPLTALLMVQSLAPKPGEMIGITAAGSTIGRMLVRMLAAIGARPLAIVRSQASCAILRDGPAEIIQEGTPLPSLVAGLDAVGGLAGDRIAAAIKPGGLLLHYGLLSGQPLTSAGTANVMVFRLRDWVHAVPRTVFHHAMDRCFAEIRTGRASSLIVGSYPLEAFKDALAHDAERGRHGKIILRM